MGEAFFRIVFSFFLFLLLSYSVSASEFLDDSYCSGSDLTKDGFVNATDLGVFASFFGKSNCGPLNFGAVVLILLKMA